MTDSTKRTPPDSVIKWCEENGYTDPEWVDCRWRAFPEGAVMSVPLPWIERLSALDIASSMDQRQPMLVEGADCLDMFGSIPVRRLTVGRLESRSSIFSRAYLGASSLELASLEEALSARLAELAADRICDIVLVSIRWETDPLNLMRFFPFQNLSMRKIRRAIAHQVWRFSDWIDDISMWIGND